MKRNLAIFDFDGTLFDTVPANHAAYAYALAPYGVALALEYFAEKCNGRYYKAFLPELLGTSDAEKLEAIHRAKIQCYPKFYGKVRENTALFSILNALSESYHIALVSTAAKESVMDILELFHRKDAFELILTQEDVPRKKPAPDGFLMAMEHFQVPPEHTVIFEDSPEGEAAAKAAGASCLMVRNFSDMERASLFSKKGL